MKKQNSMKKLQRLDLEHCYSWREYNNAINCGKTNIHLKGVSDHIEQLNDERKQYEQVMKNLIDAEKDTENKKYHFAEKWRKIKIISLFAFIGSLILMVIGIAVNPNGLLAVLLMALFFLGFCICPFLFLLAAVIEVISRKLYSRYADGLRAHIYGINSSFDYKVRTCYLAIDDIYLDSLDAAHRELVLMRREQNEHNQKLERMAEEQHRAEKANLEENRRIRQVQERLLAIEEERENRRLR